MYISAVSSLNLGSREVGERQISSHGHLLRPSGSAQESVQIDTLGIGDKTDELSSLTPPGKYSPKLSQ